MGKRFAIAITCALAISALIAGCSSGDNGQEDAEKRIVGHWVALGLYMNDDNGQKVETEAPEGLYLDMTPEGSFTVTLPSEFDAEGHPTSNMSYVGTWRWAQKLDQSSSAGFEYQFEGELPSNNGGDGGKATFLLGDLSQGKKENNPDALMFTVSVGDTYLQGLATIDGRTADDASQ